MYLPGIESKGSSLGQKTSDVAANREKRRNPQPRMNRHTATQTHKGRKVIDIGGERGWWGGYWVLNGVEGGVVHKEWEYLIGTRVGGNYFFQGPLWRCHVISISLAACSQQERGKEGVRRRKGGRGWGRASSEDGKQPTTTADSSRSAQEGGVGVECVCLCGSIHVCVCGDRDGGVRGAVKALIYLCTLRSSSIPVCCCRARGPSGPVLGESSHHIPFPLFQASLYEQHHPQIRLAFPLAPDVLCFHPGHYFQAISCCCRGERRWSVIEKQ